MKSRHTCHDCEFAEKRFVGEKFKMCVYCMQPVDPVKERNDFSPSGDMAEKEDVPYFEKVGSLRESTSFLTTSGVAFFAIFGLHMSSFNAFILGIISAILMVGLIKPTIIMLKFFGCVAILFLIGGKLVEGVTYFVDQIIRYFELWEFFEVKEKLIEGVSIFFLPGRYIKSIQKILEF